jgi:hypothetical protein
MIRRPASLWLLWIAPAVGWCTGPDAWVPARWIGGPLELDRRAGTNSAPAGAPEREAIEKWYDSATLDLLKDSPINCLVVTWSAAAGEEILKHQQELVRSYAAEAHKRGISVIGLIDTGTGAAKAANAAVEASLDGVFFEGDSAADLARESGGRFVAIPVLRDGSAARMSAGPVAAVEGVSPSARRLAEMGIRSGPSSEPWIESNIWLVRSFELAGRERPVWISYQIENGSANDYARAAADAAVAGGHWIIGLDDKLRAGLWRREAAAMETWRRINSVLRFAQKHEDWSRFTPYGNLAIVAESDSDEILNLTVRRQVPYRLLSRVQLTPDSLRRFRAVVAFQPPSPNERSILTDFVQQGGLLVAGPSWGDLAQDQRYTERTVGKGRMVMYKDPDPEAVAHDLRDLLSQEEIGITAFNVPSVITCASADETGRVLVHLLNYSNSPAEAITIRVQGNFNSARLYAPDAAPSDLALQREEGHADVSILPRLQLWGAVLLE